MFVLLEHDVRSVAVGGESAGAGDVHWDFMLEVAGLAGLRTWRLNANPIEAAGAIAAVAIGDHRVEYLTYEGEIGGGRGRVRRVDGGEAAVVGEDGASLRVVLSGNRLRGLYEIVQGVAGEAVFRRCAG